MSINKFIAIAVIAIGGLWCLINFVSTLEAAHSFYERRGTILRWLALAVLSRWVGLILFLGGICFLYYLQRGIPSWLSNRTLEMTVTSYRYSAQTKELIANVQFVNNGPVRRIVLGALFTYKPLVVEQNTRHYIVESMEELSSMGDLETPIYVEPGQPIVVTFRRKVLNEAPLNTPRTVFGLEIKSLTAAGGSNSTTVEIMEVLDPHPAIPGKTGGFVVGRRETISLDEMWRIYPMETQSQLRAQLEPSATVAAAEPSAAPSLTAKSILDRIKIIDGPDGASLAVENLEPTPTPQSPTQAQPSPTLPAYASMTSAELRQATERYINRLRQFDEELRGDEYKTILRERARILEETPGLDAWDRSLRGDSKINNGRLGALRDRFMTSFNQPVTNGTTFIPSLGAEAKVLNEALKKRGDPATHVESFKMEEKTNALRGHFQDINAVVDLIKYFEYLSQHLRPD